MPSTPMEYEVQVVGEAVPYGTNRNAAMNYARRISEKYPDDGAYVVTIEGGQPVGHIAYYRGYRDNTEGKVL